MWNSGHGSCGQGRPEPESDFQSELLPQPNSGVNNGTTAAYGKKQSNVNKRSIKIKENVLKDKENSL